MSEPSEKVPSLRDESNEEIKALTEKKEENKDKSITEIEIDYKERLIKVPSIKTEKEKPKPTVRRTKSLGFPGDSTSQFLKPPQTRRKTVGGIRVVWRTSLTPDIENLNRILGIPAQLRSVSPMRHPEPVEGVFSEYYDPLAVHARSTHNSQEVNSRIDKPISRKRNAVKKDSLTMPSVKKLLSIFERSSTTSSDPKNPSLEPKIPKTKETHFIKFSNSEKVSASFKSRDKFHKNETLESNQHSGIKPKDEIDVSLSPSRTAANLSEADNNNSSNLGDFNTYSNTENLNGFVHETSLMRFETEKITKPTTSVSLLKQKWENFVKERTKEKKVDKPLMSTFSDVIIVLLADPPQTIVKDPLIKEATTQYLEVFERSVPFARNTAVRRSVKNIAKRYESMRESSPHSKEETAAKDGMPEGSKMYRLTPSKSLDNIRSKLSVKTEDNWTIDVQPKVKEESKDNSVRKRETTWMDSLERKPSVRDLKRKFEVTQSEDQEKEIRNAKKYVEPALSLSDLRREENDVATLHPEITTKQPTSHENIEKSKFSKLNGRSDESKYSLVDSELNILSSVNAVKVASINDEMHKQKANFVSLHSKSPTKQSSIKIELAVPSTPKNGREGTSKTSSLTLVALSKYEAKPITKTRSALSTSTQTSIDTSKGNQPTKSGAATDILLKTETIEASTGSEQLTTPGSLKQKNILAVSENYSINTKEITHPIARKRTIPPQSEDVFAAALNKELDKTPTTKKTVLVTQLRTPESKNFKKTDERFSDKTTLLGNEIGSATILLSNLKDFTTETNEPIEFTSAKLSRLDSKIPEGRKGSFSIKSSPAASHAVSKDANFVSIETGPKILQSFSGPQNTTSTNSINLIKSSTLSDSTTEEDSEPKHGIKAERMSGNSRIENNDSSYPSTHTKLISLGTEDKSESPAKQIKEETPNKSLQLDFKSGEKQLLTNDAQSAQLSEKQQNTSQSSRGTIYSTFNTVAEYQSASVENISLEELSNSKADPKETLDGTEKPSAILTLKVTDNLNLVDLKGMSVSEESSSKSASKGGSKYRTKKAARRAYTDSLVKSLARSEISDNLQEIPKSLEVPNSSPHHLTFRKSLQNVAQEVHSAELVSDSHIPPFLVRKTRSKSATSFANFNKVRELKPDELKFFKELSPLSTYLSSPPSKDRASTVSTSAPTSEVKSSLERSSFERSSVRDSQKYRKLHSDEMKFFGLKTSQK